MADTEVGFFEDGFEVSGGITGMEVRNALNVILPPSDGDSEHEKANVCFVSMFYRGTRYYALGQESPRPSENLQIFLDGKAEIELEQTYTDVAVRWRKAWRAGAYTYGSRDIAGENEDIILAITGFKFLLKGQLRDAKEARTS